MGLNSAGYPGPLNGMLIPVAGTSDFQSVTSSEVDFDTTMASGEHYLFTCSTGCYLKQGAAPVAASAADGSMYVPAGLPVLIDGAQGAKLSVIRESADGVATLQRVKVTH